MNIFLSILFAFPDYKLDTEKYSDALGAHSCTYCKASFADAFIKPAFSKKCRKLNASGIKCVSFNVKSVI